MELGGYITYLDELGLSYPDQLEINSKEKKLFALGRHCLTAICKYKKPKRIFVPKYTCTSVKKTISKLDLDVTYYDIDENFLPIANIQDKDEVILLNNYFGLTLFDKDNKRYLGKLDNNQTIIDNTHMFSLENKFPEFLNFVSPRKFLPVTDGGILFDYGDFVPYNVMPDKYDKSGDRIEWLYNAVDDGGRNKSYSSFLEYRNDLQNLEYTRMSKVTNLLLTSLDVYSIILKRHENYNILCRNLPGYPFLNKINFDVSISPIGFPFYVNNSKKAQKNLADNNIYAIRYWPELDNENVSEFEQELLAHLLILPINNNIGENHLDILSSCI